MGMVNKIRVVEYCPVIELPETDFELLTALTVYGEPGRKSNQRRIVTNQSTGKPMIIKSAKAMSYESRFMQQVPEEAKIGAGSASEPLALWAHIYYASNRPDVSVELIQDLLEKAGVVKNDRWLKGFFVFGAVDKLDPRVELRIYRIL